ncbi:AAA family ATPase [Nocardia sp. NPDC049220]|uniref:AAA family ATPase n=1 Tax=Nocardia sp. NPDC049220 TaxID=3155273 RepID=UPI00340259A2
MVIRNRPRVDKLPATTADFVGRDRELEVINTLLLGSARLVTVTGPGGIGKTRLAAEAVHRFGKTKRVPVPVFWVRLARLVKDADVAAIEEEIARSVVEDDFSVRSAWELLIDTFTHTNAAGCSRRCVLVLDNCEHVLTGIATMITELLDAVPELTIMATSREAIDWVGEHRVTVPPLTSQHAMTMFRRRAELIGHPITGQDQTVTAAEICRHVHNHPLYIQLAAARLRHHPPAVILRGLTGRADDRRLRWSTGPRFGADPRHRGVSDVIAWSYELCSDTERLLFDRMAVFAAGHDTNLDNGGRVAAEVGADLEAVEDVCADDRESGHDEHPAPWSAGVRVVLARQEIEGLLERLVDQSLVTVHITSTTVRYSLLESMRVFAQQRLHERSTSEVDESARMAARHRRYYRDKVLYASAHWFGPAEKQLLDWARAEWDNLLTAIESSLTAPDEAALGLQICCGLIAFRVHLYKGALREIRSWTERALAATRTQIPQPIELQIHAAAQLVFIALCQARHEDAERMLENCFALCHTDAGNDWRQHPDIDTGLPAPAEFAWGMELLQVHSDPRAVTVLTRACDKAHRLGDDGAAIMCEMLAAMAASLLGTRQQALDLARRHLDHATRSKAPFVKSWAEMVWAMTLTKHGNPTEALTFGRTALAPLLAARDPWSALWAVEIRIWSIAQVITSASAATNPDRSALAALATEAAQLTGGTRTLSAKIGVDLEKMGALGPEITTAIGIARRVLGDKAFAVAETQGSRLRPELAEVQQLALGTLTIEETPKNDISDNEPASRWQELTTTEQQVATLAAAGWTNTAIAARRGKSTRTIDAQITAILQKLAITTRDDIMKHIPRHVIDTVRIESTRRPHRTSKTTRQHTPRAAQ